MPEVYVGVGSNLDAERRLNDAAAQLERAFGGVRASAVYRTAAVGVTAPDYLNAVVVFSTASDPDKVKATLEEIEDRARRSRSQPAGPVCALDLDLLLHGQRVDPQRRVPHPDVLRRAYVLGPLAELAPRLVHPLTGETLARVWAAFAGEAQLTRVGSLPSRG